MNYIIKKGKPKTMYVFILTGIFLIFSFSYSLYNYLQENLFVFQFPGDWDKPIGIIVGLFLIIRSRKFFNESKGLFIKTSGNQLIYRTRHSDSISKITLSDIKKIQEKQNRIIFTTNDSTELVIHLNKINSQKESKVIKKYLIELNISK